MELRCERGLCVAESVSRRKGGGMEVKDASKGTERSFCFNTQRPHVHFVPSPQGLPDMYMR